MSFVLNFYISCFIDYNILMYIENVSKNCSDCSYNNVHNILKNITLLSLIFNIINILSNNDLRNYIKLNNILSLIFGLLGIIKIIMLFKYLNITMSKECNECTDSWRRNFIYYYTRFLLLNIMILILLLVNLYFVINYNKLK